MSKLKFKRYWIFLLVILILAYFVYATSTIDLSGNDDGNWIGNNPILSLGLYNTSTNNIYFFNNASWFDENLNKSIQSTGIGNLIVSTSATWNGLEVDSRNAKVYTFGERTPGPNANISVFNIINNQSEFIDLSQFNLGGAVPRRASTNIYGNITYFAISDTNIFPALAQYDYARKIFLGLNETIDLNSPTGSGMSGAEIWLYSIMYVPTINRTYMGGTASDGGSRENLFFAWFNIPMNKTFNVSINWYSQLPLGNRRILALTYDYKRNVTIFAGQDALLGMFNETSNQTVNLNGTAVNNWIAGSQINSLFYDSLNDRILMALDSGKYGFYSFNSNLTYDLSGLDDNNFIGISNLYNIIHDIKTNTTYLSGNSGILAKILNFTTVIGNQPATIINNYTYPQLTPTLNNAFNVTAEVNGTELNDQILYVNFSIIASNGTTLLNNINGTHTRNGQTYNFSSTSFIADDGGTWRWNYTTRDNSSSTEVFKNGQFTIADTQAPSLNILYPLNNSNVITASITNISVNWSGTDNIRLFSLSYVLDQNYTKNTTINLYNNFSVTLSGYGKHNLTLYTNDTTGNLAVQWANFTLTNDTFSPNVTLLNPVDGSSLQEGVVAYSFNVTDDNNIRSCTLSVGGTNQLNTTAITRGIKNTISLSKAFGTYIWNVQCQDVSTNSATSASNTITLTIAQGGESGGGGGGGGSGAKTYAEKKSEGEICNFNSDCASDICSLETGKCLGAKIILGNLSIYNDRGTSDPYKLVMIPGDTRLLYILFSNNGTNNIFIKLSCDDSEFNETGSLVPGEICQWVDIKEKEITIKAGEKDKKVEFDVKLPEEANFKKEYFFNIVVTGTEKVGIAGRLGVQIKMSNIGGIFNIGKRLSQRISLFTYGENKDFSPPLGIILLLSGSILYGIIAYLLRKLEFRYMISLSLVFLILILLFFII